MENQVPHALVLTANNFEDTEATFPIEQMQKEGWEITVAAPSHGEVTGKHGHTLNVDTTFAGVDPRNYDVLVIPGGAAPKNIRNNPVAQQIVKTFFSGNKIVASICHGAQVLVSAGVVRGRHLTSYKRDDVPDEVKRAGGIWEDQEVVVDRNLITSRNKPDLPAFMRETIKAVNERVFGQQRRSA